ncbi:30S ribosomal protein S4 [Oenococcus oeni]|nr:30S ribosomal protein S4 [Oenococcus oeni]
MLAFQPLSAYYGMVVYSSQAGSSSTNRFQSKSLSRQAVRPKSICTNLGLDHLQQNGEYMSRYTGPKWRLSRRLGISLSGSGKELARRPYAPGDHGNTGRRPKLSEYATQLREKQKLRFTYGLSERQFHNLFLKAGKIRKGLHGTNFFILLETRLDSVVFRLGLASTRPQARQLVNHGHILVDGKRVTIPSYEVKPGQIISVRERSKKIVPILNSVEASLNNTPFVEFDADKLEGKLTRYPEREELGADINESLIVEYYNRLG